MRDREAEMARDSSQRDSIPSHISKLCKSGVPEATAFEGLDLDLGRIRVFFPGFLCGPCGASSNA